MAIRDEKELGEAIRKARLGRSWRQEDLARQAGTRQKLISALENGTGSPRIRTVLKVLAALDLDLDIVARDRTDFNPADY